MIGSISSLNPVMTQATQATKDKEVTGFKDALNAATKTQDDKELKEACQQVEEYMLTTIYKQMKESTKLGESLIEKGDYEETFEDFLIEEQCKQMVKAGGIGLADMMYEQMSREYAAATK